MKKEKSHPSWVRGLKCKGVKIYEKHNQQELS